uniref:Death domain-containing adapter protein BG4 n=1 Tax=Zeugodacus cucurbitae TaxID=28588 RepID=A0A0A1WHQ2_ZEUCU
MADIGPQHWCYDLLKDLAMQEPSSLDFVAELKSIFLNDINSPRRYECIRTMADLIDCLERRDIISEQNVEPLRNLGYKRLDDAIDSYIPPYSDEDIEGTNQYHCTHMANELSNKLSINGITPPTLHGSITYDNVRRSASGETAFSNTPPAGLNNSNIYPCVLTENKRRAIYKMLSQQLGTHWRMFGRELGLREGPMDEIELQYPRDLSTRVYKVLQLFEEDECNNPKTHLRIIKDALDRSRRKDLRRKIDDILSY